MKILLGLFLCLMFAGAGFGQIRLGTDVAFKVSVDAKDPQIKELIEKHLSTGIEKMYGHDIYISDQNYDYWVDVKAAEIAAPDSKAVGYALSILISKAMTAKISSNQNIFVNALINHQLVMTNHDQLKTDLDDLLKFIKSNISIKIGNRQL